MKTQLRVRTRVQAGWEDKILDCEYWETTGDDGETRLKGQCLDLQGRVKNTAVAFPTSYNGIVLNCDGQLTMGGCG